MKVIIIVTAVVLLLIASFVYKRTEEGYMDLSSGSIAPVLPDVSPSMWDYYGNYNDYLMDQLVSKDKRVFYDRSVAPYCDKPNRNRNFLVNPLLTQKNIFIKPNLNAFAGNDHALPDFSNSAEAIRIGAFEELMVPQTDPWYSGNFSQVVKDFKNPAVRRRFEEDYMYRCGHSSNPNENVVPVNTWNNPY